MRLALPNNVYSPDHLRFCSEELKTYASILRRRDRGSDRIEVPELSPESQSLLASLPKARQLNVGVVETLAGELEKWAVKAPVVIITLAALAPLHLKMDLVGWMREHLSRNLLVEFHVNPDIAGGMVVHTTNKVFDFSFRSHLLEEPGRFVRILENV